MVGRPLLLTPELIARAGRLRDEGATVAEIGRTLGISRRSVFTAVKRVPEDPLPTWERHDLEPALVTAIVRGAQRDWRAAAWLLERRWPERWGRADEREPVALPPEDDPFREVDQIAAARVLREGRLPPPDEPAAAIAPSR